MQRLKAMEQLETAIVVRMAFAGAETWVEFVDQLGAIALPGAAQRHE